MGYAPHIRHVSFRFRAYPTKEQCVVLDSWQNAQRALWNAAHSQRLERLRRSNGYDQRTGKRWLGWYDQIVELTVCRTEFDWLREVPSAIQRDLLDQVDKAWKLFRAKRTSERRRPKRGQESSANYRKSQRRVAKLYQKVRRCRADFLHILSHHYANNRSAVVIEDLRTVSMAKSARGTVLAPAKRISGKAGLNREIYASGWRLLRRQLTYKCEWYGSRLVVVDPRYTSQACQQCGCIDRRSRATQMLFWCVECGFIDHADVNAAKNILDRGIGPTGTTTVAACGGFDGSRPMKQEEIRVSELETGSLSESRLVGEGVAVVNERGDCR